MEKPHVNSMVIFMKINSEHIMLHCTALQETRNNVIACLQQPFKESILIIRPFLIVCCLKKIQKK